MAITDVDPPPRLTVRAEDFDENVREVIWILMRLEGIRSLEVLGDRASITKSTIYNRMKTNSFTGRELAAIAEALGAPPAIFFESAPALQQRIRAGVLLTGRYQAYGQVRTALELARLAGPNQLSLDDAPRYDLPPRRVPIRLAG